MSLGEAKFLDKTPERDIPKVVAGNVLQGECVMNKEEAHYDT